MPCSSTTITRTSGRIRYWTAAINENGIVYLGDGSWGKIERPDTPAKRPYLAVTDEAYHCRVHRIEGRERFHVALSERGRVVDVCRTAKRSHRRTT